MSFKRLLVLLIALALVFPSAFSNTTEAAADTISIKLSNYIGNKTELQFSFTGEHTLNEDTSIKLTANKKYKAKIESGKIDLYDPDGKKLKTFSSSFTISAKSYSTSSVHTIYGNTTRGYLGDIKYEVEGGKYVRPTNINIPFEDYLKGVVPREMPALWNLEALKAQAVAARTYSAGSIGTTQPDTQSFQVYGGYDWHPNSSKAVDDTKGKVLKYNGSRISAVYSSSNGGYTESNSNLWGSAQVPYLPAKKDTYDPQNPWSFNFKKEQIDVRKLNLAKPQEWWSSTNEANATIANGIKNSLYSLSSYKDTEIKLVSIPELSLSGKNSSGRSTNASLKVTFFVKDKASNSFRMQNGKVRTYSETLKKTANEMRTILGASNMKSTLLTEQSILQHTRLGGLNRFEVAANVAKEGWSSANTVVIANWEAFGDALAATTLAYQKNAPILLTQSNKLHAASKQEIQRLKPTNAIIVGGPISVSKNIENELKSLGVKTIDRKGGNSRFEVAYNIAKDVKPSDTAIVAKGHIFADTLSIAAYAARMGYPIFLTYEDTLPAATVKGLKENGIKKTIVLGGSLSVSDKVFKQLPNPTRIGGNNRYEVSANVVSVLGLNPSKAFLATGRTFGDALTGSVLAAKQNAIVLLTVSEGLPPMTKKIIEEKPINDFTVLGGPISVSENISKNLPGVSYKLAGKGFGHGVGMSQYGANAMGKAGKNYQQILSFYYPNAELVNN
ncbi:SpoIID/LytB domain-containing protein [Robertmurraya massiliosenegalensis]|uniref:SpoIID/LytB domain-containing protein n=1 Tax=Robertmurraya TaxID=2837507 RepID=UPI0039A50BE5